MIIAIINGYEITEFEFETELQNLMERAQIQVPTIEDKMQAINQLIDAYIILEESKKSGIKIPDDEIQNKFLDIMLEFDSENDFKEMLKSNNLTYQNIRQKIYNDLLISNFFNKNFKDKVSVSYDKLREVYDENKDSFYSQGAIRASHILIKGTNDESYRKILEVKEKIKTSDDFMKEAAKCSDCPSSCNFGDLGYFEQGKMVKELDNVAFKLAVGEISEPVKTKFGYHLIIVTDKKAPSTATFEAVKESLANRLKDIEAEINFIKFIVKSFCFLPIFIYKEKL